MFRFILFAVILIPTSYCTLIELKANNILDLISPDTATTNLINLSGKHISSIAENALQRFTNLESFSITGNSIKRVGGNLFATNVKLKDIRMDSNEIQEIDSISLRPLVNLESISFYLNALLSIPEDLFENNLQLKKIDFTNNKIEQIYPRTFVHLTKLATIFFTSNKLKSLNYNLFAPSGALLIIKVDENDLQEIEYKAIEQHLPHLKNIGIADNPFNCSFMRAMIDYFTTVSIHVTDNDFNFSGGVSNLSVYGLHCLEDKEDSRSPKQIDNHKEIEIAGFGRSPPSATQPSGCDRMPANIALVTLISFVHRFFEL